MTIMSFAHLKKKQDISTSPSVDIQELKPETKKVVPKATTKTNQNYRIPAISLTAKISAVNYCRGCDRFIRAGPDAELNGGYGWCLRKGTLGGDDEEWRPIPESARVKQCRYWIEYLKNKETKK